MPHTPTIVDAAFEAAPLVAFDPGAEPVLDGFERIAARSDYATNLVLWRDTIESPQTQELVADEPDDTTLAHIDELLAVIA